MTQPHAVVLAQQWSVAALDAEHVGVVSHRAVEAAHAAAFIVGEHQSRRDIEGAATRNM